MPNQNYTLIINHPKRGEKVLTSLLSELETSIGFYFSVAFITTSGVACIIEQLKRLEEAGVKGKILTSQYLNFTQPDALARLLQFANLEVRIETRKAFHSKGYLFEKEKDKYNLVLGSSNLTQNALTTNVELNISMTELNGSDELVENYLGDFQEQWQNATLVNGDFISEYRELYERIKDSRTNFIEDPSQGYGPIVQDPVGCYPNLMAYF